MRMKNQIRLGAALGAGLVTSLTMLPQARGELVLEEQSPAAPMAQAQVVTQSPVTVRQTTVAQQQPVVQYQYQQPAQYQQQPIGQPVVQYQAIAPQPAAQPVQQYPAQQQYQTQYQQPQMAPAVTNPMVNPIAQEESVTTMGTIRQQRLKTESHNEDLLQQRLEQLRLQDEMRRLDTIFGANGQPVPGQQAGMAPPGSTIQEVVVTPAGTGAPVAAPAMDPALGAAVGGTSVAATPVVVVEPTSEKSTFSLSLRGGRANMTGNAYYDVRSEKSVGFLAGMGLAENFTLLAGYSYNTYGVAMASSNPYIQQIQAYAAQRGGGLETLTMNQNVIELNGKLHALGAESRFRPYVIGGVAYSFSYINYSETFRNWMRNSSVQGYDRDYEVSSYLGSIGGGADIRVSKSFSLGAEFKYYSVLSAKENNQVNNLAFGYQADPYSDPDKAAAGGSLARASFYTILGTLVFTF